MNISKHMEIIFVAATVFACSLAYAAPLQAVTDAAASAYQQQAPAKGGAAVQTVVITAKRLHS